MIGMTGSHVEILTATSGSKLLVPPTYIVIDKQDLDRIRLKTTNSIGIKEFVMKKNWPQYLH